MSTFSGDSGVTGLQQHGDLTLFNIMEKLFTSLAFAKAEQAEHVLILTMILKHQTQQAWFHKIAPKKTTNPEMH